MLPRWLVLLTALSAAPAWGASKNVIAALGDVAPGGGVFVGPSLIGAPTAAGSGWTAFRTALVQGQTSEAIVVTNYATRQRRAISTGDTISPEIGKIRRFLGGPSINGKGHVAFAALVSPPSPAEGEEAPELEYEPAGIFVSNGVSIRRVAMSGDTTTAGTIDLASAVDPEDTGTDLPERTPAINDAGDVAFLASVAGGSGAAIIVQRAGKDERVVAIATGTPFQSESITRLGPPAMNGAGVLAFRAVSRNLAGPSITPSTIGLFTLAGDTAVRIAASGMVVHIEEPRPHDQPIEDFDPGLSINDAGDVAFTAGPIFDPRSSGDDGAPCPFVFHDGAIHPVAARGQIINANEITSSALHLDAGGGSAPPTVMADGTVIFYVETNDGPGGMIARAAPPDYDAIETIVQISRAGSTPVGGIYRFASTSPAVDADGAVSFGAEIAGTLVGEAMVHLPVGGGGEAIGLGDAAPPTASGVLGGPPFSSPLVNDRGDVAFKGFVTRGPGLGIFRARDARLDALVRILDTAPVGGSDDTPPRFLDLLGEPTMNASGEVAFAAYVEGRGNGIFAAGDDGVRKVAMPGDPVESSDLHNVTVRTTADNPAIMDDGSVVFGGRIRRTVRADPTSPAVNELGLLKSDGTKITIEALVGGSSGTDYPFYRFRDPSAAGNVYALRVDLGEGQTERTALMVSGPNGLSVVLQEGADVGGGLRVASLRGRPGVNGAGATTILGLLYAPPATTTSTAVLRTRAGVTEVVTTTGEPGPTGGTLRSLGRPTMASDGSVAFRGTFEPGTGGTAGIFVSDGSESVSQLVVGEQPSARVRGRITGLGQDVTLNAVGQLAFRATVSGGQAGQIIGLASPAKLHKGQARLRLGLSTADDPQDVVRFSATLEPGIASDGFDPNADAVSVALTDSQITIWSATVPRSSLAPRRRIAKLPKTAGLESMRALKVTRGRQNRLIVSGKSTLADLTQAGLRRIEPPITMRIDLGDDSALVRIDCKARGKKLVCK